MGYTKESLKGIMTEIADLNSAELKESGQEDDWTRVMMSAFTLTAWESSIHVKNRK